MHAVGHHPLQILQILEEEQSSASYAYVYLDGVVFIRINAVFPNDRLEGEVGRWVRRMGMLSPTALAVAKAAINADQDGSAGISLMGGHITRLFYMSDEAKEGRDAYLEGRPPQFRKIPQSKL